ncbi:hypothetical protein P8C59_008794 [Phyllachora maydis]|uniref:Smr domain-containing protein n=1 Tax=Phyllachora maydis TaxID=1825666 RepID=A0AAD9IBC4_9PEZI|nr:hypothetical protein P8C59_008794 [Phyllachora maydis]
MGKGTGVGRRRDQHPSTKPLTAALAEPDSPVSPGPDGETLVKKLIAEFGALLDESLIRAVASDRDICTEYTLVRHDLIPLADSAFAEEETGFDPSGLSSTYHAQDGPMDSSPAPCGSSRFEALRLDESDERENENENEGITLASNAGNSASVPPTICSTGNGTSASDDWAPSSVEDGFGTAQDDDDLPFTAGDQDQLTEDEKICHLLEIFSDFKVHTIKFILKESGGDLSKAFDTLLTRQQLQEEGELGKGIDGFFVPDENMTAVRGSGRGRRKKARSQGNKKLIPVKYGVKSPDIEDAELEGADSLPMDRSRRQKKPATYSADDADAVYPLPQRCLPHDHGADDYVDVRSRLRTAGELARKGGYYRAAASVYAARAQDGLQTMSSKISVAAERHVAATSRPAWIDLHGVSVMDGVRIAKQRVQAWWDGMDGEGRERTRRGQPREGFTVVTGVGNHNTGGVSRLRQAVGAALRSDGWRTETLTGKFYVTGRR